MPPPLMACTKLFDLPFSACSKNNGPPHIYCSGVQGWRSGESTRLPPMWPGFDSQIRRQMWVEFVGSLLYTVFSGYSGFPSPQKPNFDLIVSIVNLISNVPYKRSSARKSRHLNKVPCLTLLEPAPPPLTL